MSDEQVRQIQIRVGNEYGLHARPAGLIAREAQKFDSDIYILYKDQKINAKSILDILTLALSKGSRFELQAKGPDASKALGALEELLRNHFKEER